MAPNDASTAAFDGALDRPTPIGVKLGSSRTVVVYRDGTQTAIIQELSCLTSYHDGLVGNRMELHGGTAASEYPNESQFMLRNGMPTDDEGIEYTVTFFERLLEDTDVPAHSSAVFAVPAIRNDAALQRLEQVIDDIPVGEGFIRCYPESLCGSFQAFDSMAGALDETFLAVNMGATTLGTCVFTYGQQLRQRSTSTITGDRVDRDIANYIEAETQGRVNLDKTTAREYKERHADFEDYEPFTDVVQQPGGGSYEFTVGRGVMDAIDEYLDDVVADISNSFMPDISRNYPESYDRMLDAPIVVTGGMACIPGLVDAFAARLCEAMQRNVTATRPPRPDLAAARGAYQIAVGLTE